VAAVTPYTDGENAGKQDRKEKDKGHDGDGTSKSGDIFAMSFLFIYLSVI
jgi:hypothetical protein